MLDLIIEADNKKEITDYLQVHDELTPNGGIQKLETEKKYRCKVEIIYQDGIVRGEDAKRIWDEIHRERTPEEIKKSERGAKKLEKLFEGKVKW